MQLLAVLGMHRSGTSIVAGLLRALGWDVGPEEDLMPPKPDNPRGFVEHLPAVRVNDRLLNRLGGSWKQPPPLPQGWQHREDLDDLRTQAASVVDRLTQHDADRVLVKDPRLSLTLPFWQTVIDIDRAVLVLRPPRPVVRSLLRRDDGLDADTAATLWLRYTVTTLRLDVELHVVSPEELLTDLDAQLRRLGRELGHAPTEEELAAAGRQVEGGLWGRSSRQGIDATLDRPSVAAAAQVHDVLVGPDAAAWRTTFGQLTTVEELAAADRLLAAQRTELVATADELRERITGLSGELERTRQRADRLLAERERARAQQ